MEQKHHTAADLTDVPDSLQEQVLKWRNFARQRPEHTPKPSSAQESVWDYPRPPRVESVMAVISVVHRGVTIACSQQAYRVIETSGAPVYYIPTDDIDMQYLQPIELQTLCEWKGSSTYFDVKVGDSNAEAAAWSYPEPWGEFALIAGYIAFHPAKVDECWVNEELATPQPGSYYGGWVTRSVIGPFKGEPGSENW